MKFYKKEMQLKKRSFMLLSSSLLLLGGCSFVSGGSKGTWNIVTGSDHECPDTVTFEGDETIIWEKNEDGETSVIETTYTRYFKDDYVIETSRVISGDEIYYIDEEEKFLMQFDDDRIQIVFDKNQYYAKWCTYGNE